MVVKGDTSRISRQSAGKRPITLYLEYVFCCISHLQAVGCWPVVGMTEECLLNPSSCIWYLDFFVFSLRGVWNVTMNRRDFLTRVSTASLGGFASTRHIFGQSTPIHKPRRYKHRVQFGAWINDMRNEALPRENWPCKILDDSTEKSIIECLELGRQTGFNQFDVFGLFATDSYPLDIKRAFADKQRKTRVNRILKAARDRGIKNIFGLGVYSWGFDEIIQHDPSVRGPNKHAMCGSAPESFQWQTKLIDVILAEIDVDGFHLESADLGRCTCERCAPINNVQYHCRLNAQTADYIRSQASDKVVSSIMLGWGTWGQDFTDEEKSPSGRPEPTC